VKSSSKFSIVYVSFGLHHHGGTPPKNNSNFAGGFPPSQRTDAVLPSAPPRPGRIAGGIRRALSEPRRGELRSRPGDPVWARPAPSGVAQQGALLLV